MWLYWGMRLAQRLAAALPRRFLYSLAVVGSDVVFSLWREKRENLIANMAQVLDRDPGDRQVQALAQRSSRNYAMYLIEFFSLPHTTPADLATGLRQVSGWEHVETALAQGHGVIFVSAHFGNWDIAGAYFAQHHPVSVVAETFQPARLNELVQRTRTDKGMRIIPLEHAARPLLRALQRNEIVGLVIDRPVHGQREGVPIRLFGRETHWPSGAAALAMKTGAPVLAAGCWRNPDNSYSGLIVPPIHCQMTGHWERDLQRNMQQIVAALEQIIRPHPDQWYAFRQMWP